MQLAFLELCHDLGDLLLGLAALGITAFQTLHVFFAVNLIHRNV